MYTDDEKRGWREAETTTSEEQNEAEGLLERATSRKTQGSGFLHGGAYTLLTLIIVVQSIILIRWRTELAEHPPKVSKLGLSTLRNKTLDSGLLNRFWEDDNLTGPNEAWAGINSGHGVIALDIDYATRQGFPDTIIHPYHDDKVVYALEAYHLIHCIQVLRKDYLLVRDNKTPTKPLEHAMHCYDALRQSVMCSASDDLLIVTGHGHKGGFNQTRQCRDWDVLRDYATANTACYWDDELPEGQDDPWKMCDDGSDGLPVGNLLN
ncbi:hypothetical protein M409DRAFT_29235 [Zasmidium cellare ATCC 36951]|uniref:Uncharacterized protein n=1 Tax=Zasmidium cellare ATCC 36951 TaxID=1080233 RepID=A0A6A6C3R4_ZASCE|nr:uncharacterized protein M409DRAFT_29235 [Zasmidium cellare ATCC 36951]KAF2160389.1 hypothetical protein M409DRAFT_29235 [Zasmidium cellare ATCC 36951]